VWRAAAKEALRAIELPTCYLVPKENTMLTGLKNVFRSRTSRAAILPAVLALAVMLGATPAFAKTDRTQVPFKGTLQATETTVAFVFPFGYQDATGSGNATQLGRYTLHYTVVVNVVNITGTESAEFVAANGDRLFSEGTGQATTTADPNIDNIVEQYTITGGTGRFAGATGSFTLYRVLNLATGVTSGTFDGVIVLSNGNYTRPALYRHYRSFPWRSVDFVIPDFTLASERPSNMD
jgi:hypothetical protein